MTRRRTRSANYAARRRRVPRRPAVNAATPVGNVNPRGVMLGSDEHAPPLEQLGNRGGHRNASCAAGWLRHGGALRWKHTLIRRRRVECDAGCDILRRHRVEARQSLVASCACVDDAMGLSRCAPDGGGRISLSGRPPQQSAIHTCGKCCNARSSAKPADYRSGKKDWVDWVLPFSREHGVCWARTSTASASGGAARARCPRTTLA
jgi:hypothetical protein